jgi:hypothetical protein
MQSSKVEKVKVEKVKTVEKVKVIIYGPLFAKALKVIKEARDVLPMAKSTESFSNMAYASLKAKFEGLEVIIPSSMSKTSAESNATVVAEIVERTRQIRSAWSVYVERGR